MVWVSMKILSYNRVKNKTETVKGFKFCTFIGCFQMHHGSEGVTVEEVSPVGIRLHMYIHVHCLQTAV